MKMRINLALILTFLTIVTAGCSLRMEEPNRPTELNHNGDGGISRKVATVEGEMGYTDMEEWELVWSDEFSYAGLPDPAKWGYEVGFVRNEEAQYYMEARMENSRVADGYLLLEARKERLPKPRLGNEIADWQKSREVVEYTSASLETLNKFEFTYGRVEVRARMPQGDGVWPAIWTLGSNISEVGWPRCGEIDIMEYVGKDPGVINANSHFADPSVTEKDAHMQSGGGKITVPAPFENFHVYAVEWNEKSIEFFVDEKSYYKVEVDAAGVGPDNPFRKPHYLILNLALGGSWGGEIDDSALPQVYKIDYVRVFKARAN